MRLYCIRPELLAQPDRRETRLGYTLKAEPAVREDSLRVVSLEILEQKACYARPSPPQRRGEVER